MPGDTYKSNTLGLAARDLNALLDRIEARAASGSVNRVSTRWGYRQTSVGVVLNQPGGTAVNLRMACRNISKGGIGLLHRAYVHVNTVCTVSIEHPERGVIEIHGRVARCLHLGGIVHEVGIVFDDEVDIRSIVRPDPMIEVSSVENIDPHSLVGTVLIVEDCEMTVKLVKHFLRKTRLRVRHASTIEEAEMIVGEGVNLVLCDIHLGEEHGGDLAKRLYDRPGTTPPVVMMSADQSQSTRVLVGHPGIKGFIAKPFVQQYLVSTVAEFLRGDNDDAADNGEAKTGADQQVVAILLPELANCADQLDAAAEHGCSAVYPILLRLTGVAPVLGLSDLAMRVALLTDRISASSEIPDLRERISDIARTCRESAEAA